MQDYFKQAKHTVESVIIKKTNRGLNYDDIEERMFGYYRCEPPNLELDRINIEIGKEKLSRKQAPKYLDYSENKEYEYAKFMIPIVGKKSFVKDKLRDYPFDRNFNIRKKTLVCTIYSNLKISGNTKEIKRIRREAENKIQSINSIVSDLEKEVEKLNRNLKNFIIQTVENEKSRRDLKASSEDKLNPFK